jgi:hypothetical protein
MDMTNNDIRIAGTNSRWMQLFTWRAPYLANYKEKSKVVEVSGQDTENRNIWIREKTGKINQQWEVIYIKDMQREPKKGEMNKDFGLVVEKDFHIISALPSGRYLDILGSNIVIKTQNGRNTQKWFFDQNTRTIKSRSSTGKSFDIETSGKGSNMQIYNTNSNWW